ncbi:MAG: peptide chain release factor 2 [Candidatus Saganbacteria bacterium]|nr:peptide chain release factor 2 [Candidatus Saganbacteria bacterium]
MFEELSIKLEEEKLKIKKIESALKLADLKKKKAELEQKANNPNLWSDPVEAKKVLQELKITEGRINTFDSLKQKFDDLLLLTNEAKEENDVSLEKELEKELKEISQRITGLELITFLSGPYDQNNAILAINAGAGGTDAQDWAQILLRMFTRYVEGKGWQVEMPEINYGEEAGIKNVTLVISAPYAYGYLKSETGIHRLVRISPFSSEGKRHTSFASIEVIPEATEEIQVDINPKDLRVDTYRASGPGGQNVNKVSSAIRITHIPTGMVTQSQSSRSQHANRDTAMKLLKSRLYEQMLKEHKQKIEDLRGEKKDIAWGSQIRSYVFQPYTLVKDHRTGAETSSVQKVIDGDLDLFIESMLKGEGQK